MRITILAVGKLREAYLAQGIDEYRKRLTRYATVTIQEIAEEQAPETLSPAEQHQVKDREGERILKTLKDTHYAIALALDGKQYTSEAFANYLQHLGVTGHSNLAFIIGGSLGLAEAVLQRADVRLSFGAMTYPHQLMRLILVEQIYRGFRIMRGEPYHK